MSWRIKLNTLFILFFPSLAFLQTADILWFNPLQSRQGFSQSFNHYIYHDTEGFVWISSTAGLNRFDGLRMKQYRSTPGDSTSLAGDIVHSPFFEDKRHNIWFCTYEGIHCYNRKQDNFQQFFIKNEKGADIKEEYYVFFLEKDTFLWLYAGDGIVRFNIHQPDSTTKISQTSMNRCMADTAANGSVRFVYGFRDVKGEPLEYWEIENGKLRQRRQWFQNAGQKLVPSEVQSMQVENDTLAWLGTDKGLMTWNRRSGRLKLLVEAPSGRCSFVPLDKRRLLVLLPGRGLFSFDKFERKLREITVRIIGDFKASPKDFHDIYLDKHKNLWLSFESAGLMFANLDKVKFSCLPKKATSDGSTNYSYFYSLEDKEGNLWQGTAYNGLFRWGKQGQTVEHFLHRPRVPGSLPSDWVSSLLLDEGGKIWVGTAKGLAWFDPGDKTFHLIPGEQGPASYLVVYLYQLRNGQILASTSDGVFTVKYKEGKPVLANVLSSGMSGYTTIYEDKDSNIYICRNDVEAGVFSLQQDSLHLVKMLPVKGSARGFFEEDTTLWIATSVGLAKVDRLAQTYQLDTIFTEKDGLPDKNILAMLADNAQNLWLSTPKGLAVFQKKDGKFRQFSLADGAQSPEFHIYAAAKRRSGELWFGGSNGITIIRSDSIKFLETKPKVKITDIKINNEERPGLKDAKTGATNVTQINHLDLPYGDNTLSFEFVAIEYGDPSNNQLKYFLKGWDNDTVTLAKGEPGFARYSNLRKGNYTFWIQGANSDGVWGDPVKALEITIEPHWTNTWWFNTSLAVLLALIAYAILRYRIAQIREKAQLNTRVAENKMAALRSQMNPHFIFNSLQTVNGFISRQDLRGAIEYVNQFARLMRVILENSRVNVISLESEIELLELYLQIEAKRFSQPLTYSITAGNELDTFSTEIPPMLLQPFVENAIKHGLFHKKTPGHIAISFQRENGGLKCSVEDNGIGRAKSAQLNDQQGRSHKSRGLEIVNERLEIIRASRPGNYTVKIIDLHDLQQKPTGTRVEIILPLT
ncbi:MAG: histidine kinase [Bacteroidetes bacterium]|nr:histidine kinase [Bacteroidota bacterium]